MGVEEDGNTEEREALPPSQCHKTLNEILLFAFSCSVTQVASPSDLSLDSANSYLSRFQEPAKYFLFSVHQQLRQNSIFIEAS